MKRSRKARSCEWLLPSGLVVCSYLSLAHLRLLTGAKHVRQERMKSGQSDIVGVDMRLHCMCQVCRRAQTFSTVGSSTSLPELWLKSSDRRRTGDTSITWRMELQPTGQARSSVTSVFGPETVMDGTTAAELLTLFGANTPGSSNMAVSLGQAKRLTTS